MRTLGLMLNSLLVSQLPHYQAYIAYLYKEIIGELCL